MIARSIVDGMGEWDENVPKRCLGHSISWLALLAYGIWHPFAPGGPHRSIFVPAFPVSACNSNHESWTSSSNYVRTIFSNALKFS